MSPEQRSALFLGISLFLIFNGIKSFFFPPQSWKVYWLDMVGFLIGIAILLEVVRHATKSE